jgi:hypothetical protein
MTKKNTNRTRLWSSLQTVVEHPVTCMGVVGAALGSYFGDAHLAELLKSPEHCAAVLHGFGGDGASMLRTVHPIAGAVLLGSLAAGGTNLVKHAAWSRAELLADRTEREDYVYTLPPFPDPAKRGLALYLGEVHGEVAGGYASDPVWSIIPTAGLWGNIAAFGSIGTGKTASCAYPLLRQMFEYQPGNDERKFGGLFMDVKGDFTAKVMEMAKEYDREKDLIVITPGGRHTWNPIHAPEAPAKVIAGRLVAVHENLTGGSGKDSQWVVDGVLKLLTHSIGILRLATGYVTLKDVHQLIQEMSVDPNAQVDEEEAEEVRKPKDIVEDLHKMFKLRVASGKASQDDHEMFEIHGRFFTHEWARENPKNKPIYQGAVTTITDDFTNPKVSRTFCPPENKINFPGFPSIIDEGKIVCLDAPETEYGILASSLGIMLKLEFQRAALSRVARAKNDPSTNTVRPLLFLCDEYQNFVTVTSQRSKDGDDNFYALSRQSRCVSLVLTQSPVSLMSKLGKDKSRVILASLRTKIFFSLTDTEDLDLAANIMAKDWSAKENVSINESVMDAGWDPLTNSMSGKGSTVSESLNYNQQLSHRVLPVQIKELRTFEAFVDRFDGIRQNPPERVYMKTDFCPQEFVERGYTSRTLPYKLMIEWLERQQQED